MKEGRASRTAEYMALFRALEATRSAGRRVFEDRFAAAFLSPRLRLVVSLSKVPVVGALVRVYIDRRWPGARTSAVARTRFIDDAAEVALRSAIDQVVILGAGFDARAYRIAAMARVAVVFEVDHPSTSATKRTIVQAALTSLPRYVRFVPVDFNSEPLQGRMSAAGYDPRRRTLFIWEGVTNYLTEDAVDGTLRWCAGAAAGSTVIFTYVHRQVLDAPQAFDGTEKLFATLSAVGERWTFGLDPSQLSDFLAQRGLVLSEDVGASDYRALYFGNAAMRMRGYEFYRIAIARVPDPPLTPNTANHTLQRPALRTAAEPGR
jgi:methyltransferase (TIGR00027 family)